MHSGGVSDDDGELLPEELDLLVRLERGTLPVESSDAKSTPPVDALKNTIIVENHIPADPENTEHNNASCTLNVLQSRDGFHEHSRHASFIDADEAPLPILQLEPSLPLEPVSIERPKRRVQFQNQLPWPFSSPPGVSNQEILNRDIHFKMPVPGPAGHPGITKTSEPTTFHHENRNKTSANQLIPSAWIHNWQKMQYEFKDTVPLLALMAASRSTKFPLVMGVIRTMNRQATEILIEICNMEGVSVPCIVHKSLTNEYGHILIPGVGLVLQDISLIIYSDQRYSIEPRFLVIIPRNIRKIYYLEGDQTEENDVSLTQYRSVSLSAVSP